MNWKCLNTNLWCIYLYSVFSSSHSSYEDGIVSPVKRMWWHLPGLGWINSENISGVVATVATAQSHNHGEWKRAVENPLLPSTKSTSNWSGGTQSKMYELPWWGAVISIISDDGFTLSQIIFLSSPVNQYLLQISSLQDINNFKFYIPHHSKYSLR